MIPEETLLQAREEAETGNDHYSRGFVSAIITELLEERKKIREYQKREGIAREALRKAEGTVHYVGNWNQNIEDRSPLSVQRLRDTLAIIEQALAQLGEVG